MFILFGQFPESAIPSADVDERSVLTVIPSATTATMASATVTIMPGVTAEVSQRFYVYIKLSMVHI